MLIQVAPDRFVNADQIVEFNYTPAGTREVARTVQIGFDAGETRTSSKPTVPTLSLKLASGDTVYIDEKLADSTYTELRQHFGPTHKAYRD